MVAAIVDESLRWQLMQRYVPTLVLLGAVPRLHRTLLLCIALATALSLGVVANIDAALGVKQALWFTWGGLVVVLLQWPRVIGFVLRRSDLLLLGSGLALIAAALGGTQLGGARSWLVVGSVSFQPVELVKITVTLFWVTALTATDRRRGIVVATVASAIIAVTLVWQRDIGPLLLLVLVGLAWLSVSAGINRLFWKAVVTTAGLACIAVMLLPHVARRLVAWLRPELDAFGLGYQTLSMRATLADGGILGNGWASLAAHPLPAAATDLPHVALSRHIGVAGVVLVVLLLGVVVGHLFSVVQNQRSNPLQLVAFVGTLWLTMQAVLSLFGGSGLGPLIGLTLPLMSYGGSATVAVFAQLGILVRLRGENAFLSGKKTAGLCPRRLTWLRYGLVGLGLSVCVFLVFNGRGHGIPTRQLAAITPSAYTGGGAGITDRNGEMLMAIGEGKTQLATASLVHVIGYDDAIYGVTGLQAMFKVQRQTNGTSVWGRRLMFRHPEAAPLITTLDLRLQRAAEEALGERAGAVVVLDVWRGDVLAAVSYPRFHIGDVTDALQKTAQEAPLLNRAFQGRYAPGSAFKPVVLAAALEAGLIENSTRLYDPATLVVDGYSLTNAGNASFGHVLPTTALAMSVNTIFAQLALDVGAEGLRRQAMLFGIGDRNVPLEVPYNVGHMGAMSTPVALAATGFGQAEVMVTPLEMARVAATIGNGGFAVVPRLTLAQYNDGTVAQQTSRIMSEATAKTIANGMRLAMSIGTGAGNGDPRLLAGKTGTAQVNGRQPHAWFIGFAPADHPRIAWAVVLEHAGSGGKQAAPIGAAIANAYIQHAMTPP